MLNYMILTLQSKVSSPYFPELSQQKPLISVNYSIDYKGFIDEMHNFIK